MRADIRLVAMDLDGTLTQHKSPPEAACIEALEALSLRYKLLMVCAGGCERVYWQLGGFAVDICGWYGMQISTVSGGKLVVLHSHRAKADRWAVNAAAEALREELGFREYTGDGVEFHDSGLITFPLLGTGANLPEKLAFDPDRAKRRACLRRVREMFPGYTVFVGGTSSFDIAPLPFCKSYALNGYLERFGIGAAETVYFGDDYGPGGNDEDVYNSGMSFVPVDDYRDFPALARKLLL